MKHEIRVVNREGGGNRLAIYVGRPTPLGNPFRDMEREEAIAKYRKWLPNELKINPKAQFLMFYIAERAMEQDVDLVCSCAPLACHADVIKDYVTELCNGVMAK